MPVQKLVDAVRRMCLRMYRSVCQRVCVCLCVCLCAVCGSTLLCAEFGRGVVAAAHVAHPHCSSMPLFSSIIYSHTMYKHAHTHVHAWVGVWVSDVYICDRLFLHAYSIYKKTMFHASEINNSEVMRCTHYIYMNIHIFLRAHTHIEVCVILVMPTTFSAYRIYDTNT